MLSVENFVRYVNAEIEDATRRIFRFSAELSENPARALEWSADVFTAAASIRISNRLLREIESNPSIADLRSMLTYEVINSASSPRFSSNTTANLMSIHETAALADYLKYLNLYSE